MAAELNFVDLDTLRSPEELMDYQKELRTRIVQLDTDRAGGAFTADDTAEWDRANADYDAAGKRVTELTKRRDRIAAIAEDASDPAVEREQGERGLPREAQGSRREASIYDLSTIRVDLSRPDRTRGEFQERARRAIEHEKFPLAADRKLREKYGDWSDDDCRAHIDGLLEKDTEQGAFAQRILLTGSPAYKRAYAKVMSGNAFMSFTPEEQRAINAAASFERAFSTGTTGLPVPYTLDPTVIPVSSHVINPWRAICRTEQIVGNEWRGVTAAAVTAAYAAEGTEASDNTPTLAQPTDQAKRAQVFIPFSIESGQDWGAMQAAMAMLIADAKDVLESNKFFSGSGTNEPTGINAATSAIDITTVGSAAFVIADLYALEAGIPPRFLANAQLVAHQGVFARVRQFDTAGGAGLWLSVGQTVGRNRPNTGAELLGYGSWKSSQMLNVLTTGSRIMVGGDFSYYLIIDRVGMSLEVIPHLFGAANRFPTGQRGLYGFWRNSGKLIDQSALRFLKTS